ncbi:hypothetical protein GY26_16040 [Gammaproteobacteria bacterium MFB021]|nr:hypothetical protein GY26_16040 [Gammaproteobacteria bacterium MFB021]
MPGPNVTLQFVDFDQVLQQLEQVGQKLRTGAVRAGLVSVAAPIKRTAKELAPRQTGDLARAINHRSVRKRDRARLGVAEGEVAIVVGAGRKVNGRSQLAKQGWQERGTRRMGANPFLAPALQNNSSGIEHRFYAGMSRYLEKKA